MMSDELSGTAPPEDGGLVVNLTVDELRDIIREEQSGPDWEGLADTIEQLAKVIEQVKHPQNPLGWQVRAREGMERLVKSLRE